MTAQDSAANLVYRQPLVAECDLLWRIAMRSKQHWGYDDEFMQSCRDELKVSPEKLTSKKYYYKLAELNKSVLGFYCLEKLNVKEMEVEALFVAPDYIGKGLGAKLWKQLLVDSRTMGCRKLVIASDPFAEPFYQKMGAKNVGEIASGSISGRYLPLMEYQL